MKTRQTPNPDAPRTVRVNFAEATPPTPSTARTWSLQQDAIFTWFETSQVVEVHTGEGHRPMSTPRNLVVRARAGTGKTTTIVEGVSRAPERQILLAAFNREIAQELERRVRNPRVEVKTLHGLGLRYIRRNWRVEVEDSNRRGERAASLARRSAPDAPDQVLRIVASLHTKARELMPRASVRDVEDIAYRFDIVPDESWQDDGWSVGRVAECAHRAMQLAKVQTGVVDYADMIFLPVAMRWIRPWFDLVVVDEAQDMTETQLEIARGACRRTGRVCVVGDDRQAIYGFRGADSGSLDRLKKELGAAELGLTVTYRCGSLIVDLARQLVPDFTAAPGAARGEIVRCDDERMLDDVREGDFVISRKNAPLVGVCMSLLKRGTRARIRGRDIGKGIVALIRRLKASTIADLPRLLDAYVEREIAKTSKLAEAAREAREELVRDQRDVVTALCEGAATLRELETRVEELFSDDDSRGAVLCTTVHKVKGLEADRTFLLEGTFRRGLEEDNIRYVAITRARQRLCWVSGFGEKAKAASEAA